MWNFGVIELSGNLSEQLNVSVEKQWSMGSPARVPVAVTDCAGGMHCDLVLTQRPAWLIELLEQLELTNGCPEPIRCYLTPKPPPCINVVAILVRLPLVALQCAFTS